MKKWIYVYVVIIFTVLGVGIYIHSDKVSPAQETVVSGTVVDYEARQSRDSRGRTSTSYAEIISFELNGTTHRFTRGTSFGWKPKIGRVRKLVVDPARPHHARVQASSWLEKLVPSTLKQYPVIIMLWIMGSAFFAFGWFQVLYDYEFFRRAIRIPGKVTDYDTQVGSKGNVTYVEVVSYDFDGQTRTIKSNVGMPFKPKMGTMREVGVNPDDIQKARVNSGRWFGVIFALAGLLLWSLLLVADKFH